MYDYSEYSGYLDTFSSFGSDYIQTNVILSIKSAVIATPVCCQGRKHA